MRKAIAQISFQQGIVENIKQNSLSNEGVLLSALYLENFNPNIEFKSLVKRYGEITHYPTLEAVFKLSNEKPNRLSTYSDFMFPYQYTANWVNDIQCNPFYHITQILTSRPGYNSTYVIFAGRYDESQVESTAVIGFVLEYNDSNTLLTPRWIEPFRYKNLDYDQFALIEPSYPLDNAGKWVYGTFQDVARYGSLLLFTTKPFFIPYDDFQKKNELFPCYVWGLYDNSSKRLEGNDRYWNGVTLDLNKSKSVRWKVRQPTLRILGDLFNVKSVRADSIIPDTYYDKTEPPGSPNITTGDIQVVFHEQPLYSGTQYNIDDSYHLLTWPDGMFNYLQRHNYYNKNNVKWDPVDADKTDFDNLMFTPEIIDIASWKEHLSDVGWMLCNGIFGRLKLANGDLHPDGNFDAETETMEIAVTKGELEDANGKDLTRVVLTQALIDYEGLGIPRPWIRGENIPFILTIFIDGIEYTLLKDVYTIYGDVNDYVNTNVADGSEIGLYDTPLHFIVKDHFTHQNHDYIAVDKAFITSGQLDTAPDRYYYKTYTSIKVSPQFFVQPGGEIKLAHMLKIDLRINKDIMETLMEIGVTQFNLYVSQASDSKRLVDWWGVEHWDKMEGLEYAKESITDINDPDIDYSKFRLVQTWLVEGKGKPDANDTYDNYVGKYEIPMNGWTDRGDGWLYSTPQEPDLSNRDLNEYYEGGNTKEWTPNFILWDYPTSKSLSLGGSGQYWEGKGAEYICVTKGRVFLDNTLDENGKLEQGITRYSLVQNGKASLDAFYKEDYFRTGHLPCTGLLEYREHLWKFNRQSFYRIALNEIFEPSTWEYLDAEHGVGNFSKKTVCLTPLGVAFCNEKGIWLSDGRKPECITEIPDNGIAITSLYQKLTTNKVYVFQGINNPGEVIIGSEGFNEYMELIYDEANNELVLITPIRRENREDDYNIELTDYDLFSDELRLIFSFTQKNWRVEQFPYIDSNPFSASHPTSEKLIRTYSKVGRTHFARPNIHTLRWWPVHQDNSLIDYRIEISNGDTRSLLDIFWCYYTAEIMAKVITHEIGNGVNDALLNQIIAEAIPREDSIFEFSEWVYANNNIFDVIGWQSYNYSFFEDPKLEYELRSKTLNYQTLEYRKDIIKANMDVKGGLNPFVSIMQTPTDLSDEEFTDVNMNTSPYVARESLIMISPLWTKFRRMKLKYVSRFTSSLKSLIIKYNEKTRKT